MYQFSNCLPCITAKMEKERKKERRKERKKERKKEKSIVLRDLFNDHINLNMVRKIFTKD